MTALTIAVAIIGIVVVFQGILLVGLLRAYRQLGAAPTTDPPLAPPPGFALSTAGLPGELARRLEPTLSGVAIVALLTTTCRACEQALATLARSADLPVALTVILSERGEWPQGMRESLRELSERASVVVTDAELDTLPSLGPPTGFPTIVVLRNAVVLHSTYSPDDALSFASRLARV